MSLVTFEIAAVQALLAMQGSISFSPFSEMGITEIIAAEALLQLRGIGKQSPPETPEPPVPSTLCLLTVPQNAGIPATFQETEDLEISARLSTSTVTVDESSSSMTMEEVSPRMSRKRRRSYTSESSDQSGSDEFLHALEPSGSNVIRIGDGNANVPMEIYKSIKWDSYTMATRKLLTAIFPRHILATHSLTGKRSPAFPNRPAKEKLDPKLVHDIVKTVVEKCGVAENIVRTAITNKCADESKMLRHRKKQKREDDEE